MAMQVFVPMPDEGFDVQALAGVRLVPYRAGMALWASVAVAIQSGASAPKGPATPAAPRDRLP
jgi:hypothetical protein